MTERRTDDAYQTPDALALAICMRLAEVIWRPGTVLEPSAGAGAFVRAARAVGWPRIYAYDIREECRAPCEAAGATFSWLDFPRSRAVESVDLILGNPPYWAAEEHVARALAGLAPGGHLAFLLRLSFLTTQGRCDRIWSKPGLRYLAPVRERPDFTGGGGDNSEYALFVWEAGYLGNAEILPPLRWSPGIARAAAAGGAGA